MPHIHIDRPSRRVIVRIVVGIATALCMIELCVELAAVTLKDGGAPKNTQKGNLIIKYPPTTEQEYVATAIRTLQEIGWWQNEPKLVDIFRQIDCAEVLLPPNKRSLSFMNYSKVTLFSGWLQTADVEIDGDRLSLSYTLIDWEIDKIRHVTGIAPDKIVIDTDKALDLVEANGGEKLRPLINNDCYVYFHLSNHSKDWEIDYIKNNTLDLILCFDINYQTGQITRVAARGVEQCQYYEQVEK